MELDDVLSELDVQEENSKKVEHDRARRRELRQIPARTLAADYVGFSDDQLINEKYVAARLQKSRAWVQWKRVAGGGPRFFRTDTGKILYRKADVEAYLSASLTSYDN